MKIDWKLNGRRVSPGKVGQELGKAIKKAAEDAAEKEVRRRAGAGARVRRRRTPSGHLEFRVTGTKDQIDKLKQKKVPK